MKDKFLLFAGCSESLTTTYGPDGEQFNILGRQKDESGYQLRAECHLIVSVIHHMVRPIIEEELMDDGTIWTLFKRPSL